MPSQEDYLDSLLKNLEPDYVDTNDIEENEFLADDLTDTDPQIENAVSELEAAFESDDNVNLEKLLGLESTFEPDHEVAQNDGEISESAMFEDALSELNEVLGEEPDAEFGEETFPELDAESGELQISDDKTDELDLDEIYSDIGLLSEDNGEIEADSEVNSVQQDAAPDLDALSSMSEDEIERLLSVGAEEDSAPLDEEMLPDDEELLSMLDDVDDDLQDIQDMLHRADNNEAVDESLLQRDSDKEDEFNGLPGGEDELQNTLNEKEQKAQQKKLRKQEKAAAKAEKAAAKAAAKAEKAAAKAAAKAGEAAGTASKTSATAAGGVSEGNPGGNPASTDVKKGSSGTLFDTSLLDSIVAGAEQAGSEGMTAAVPEGAGNANSGEDVGGASSGQNEIDSDEFDVNMDSLFGEDEDGDLSAQNDASSSSSTSPKTRKTDAAITEHEGSQPKKGGFFAKILDFLTEDDEEDEESASLQLSDENRDILNDLDNEKAGDKKKKKGASKADKGKAKAKKSKAKKTKAPKKPKKPKKPKPEKPKKEKTPEPEPLIPEQKLTLKKVMPVVLVGVSLCVFIILLTNVSVDFADKQAAAEAFEAGDYQTCFQNLYGKNLNETEQLMYGKSESILYIRLWLREYEMFAQDGAEVEALDSLIQTVNDYPKLYNYAVQWDAGAEVAAGYQTVLSILREKYGLTEEQAREIAAERSDRKYTRMIVEIILGNGYESLDEQPPASESEQQNSNTESEQADLQDVLPEEEGLGEGEFIEN